MHEPFSGTHETFALRTYGRHTPTQDELEFRAFAKVIGPRITRALAYMTKDEGLIEEAAQDAVLLVWQRWETLRDGTIRDIDGYAVKIAMNKVLNALRKKKRREEHETDLPAEEADYQYPGPVEELPEVVFERRAQVQVVMQAMRQLAERYPAQARVMALRYLLGYETAQIADLLEQPPATVRSNLRHGRVNLHHIVAMINDRATGQEGATDE